MSKLVDCSRRRARCLAADERGLSLVEMSVVMLILALVVPMITGLLVSVQNDTAFTTSRDAATGELLPVQEALSRQLHAAQIPQGMGQAFVVAQANNLEFYSALGNSAGPTLVSISFSPTCSGCATYELVESLTQPVLSGGLPTYGSAPTRHVLGSGLVPANPSPPQDCPGTGSPGTFAYLDSSGHCLPLDTSLSPPALDPSQLGLVDAIWVSLEAKDTLHPDRAASSSVALQISLPNMDFASDEETSTTTS